jgi:hypothetical protein
MFEEEAGPEKKQNQTDVRLLREWYRAVGLSEDEVARLIRETTADERPTAVHTSPGITDRPRFR